MADLSERLQAALAHRYQIERALGHGGMASVYLARDLKERSRRFVAIKVLDPESALAVRTERFLREIEIAGQLTHTGILPLHESGEVEGFHYYVMPFVSGPSLKERLAGSRRLPIAEAVRIAEEVAEALAYAHGRGIVHRDIKPANLLFIENHPVIADFGIARGVSTPKDAEITDKGGVIGTPAYMSPEQIRGGEVDARSDIYSLGCVLYEMIEGRPPYVGETGDAVRAGHLADPVPSLRRRGVPLAVRAAITKALAKTPRERFASAAQFATTLRERTFPESVRKWGVRIGGGVAAAVLLGLMIPPPGPEPVAIAVQSPIDMSRDTANEYLGPGIAEDFISLLSNLPQMRIIGRPVDSASLSNPELADLLRVNHVLESSIRSDRDSVRFTARLIRLSDAQTVWSGTYDRARGSILALQKEISWAIVEALRIRLQGDETTLVQRSCTEDPEAYDDYLRGRYLWSHRSRASMIQAITYFRSAVAKDTAYACAYSGLADALVLSGQFGYLPREQAYQQAKAAALRAVTLDELRPEAHTSLARTYQNYDWDWVRAEREYRRAIELNPRYVLARTWYGMFLARGLGRFDEAAAEVMAGHDLDPASPWTNNNVVVVMMYARRYDEAIEYARRAITLSPDWVTPHADLADTYRWKGMYPEALAEYRIAERLGREVRGAVGYVYARTGRRAEALQLRRELEALSRRQNVWSPLATLYVGLGEHDLAFAALDSLVRTRSFSRGEPTLKSDPDWDSLRSDPRFAALLRRIGLTP